MKKIIKKVITYLVVLLMIAGVGIAGYYFKKAKNTLNKFTNGEQYYRLGWEIVIPSTDKEIKGKIKSYIDLTNKEIVFKFWGKAIGRFKGGKIVANFRNPKTASLIFDIIKLGGVTYTNLSFDLTPDHSITRLYAKKIQIDPTEINIKKFYESQIKIAAIFEDFEVKISDVNELVPDAFIPDELIPDFINLDIKRLTIHEVNSLGQETSFIFDHLWSQFRSKPNDPIPNDSTLNYPIRTWKSSLEVDEYTVIKKQNEILFELPVFRASGIIKNVKREEVSQSRQKLFEVFSSTQTTLNKVMEVFKIVDELIVFLDPLPSYSEVRCAGLSIKEKNEEKVYAVIDSLFLRERTTQAEGGSYIKGGGRLEGIYINFKEPKLSSALVSFDFSVNFSQKKFRDILSSYFRHFIFLKGFESIINLYPLQVNFRIMEKVKQDSSSILVFLGDYVKMNEAKNTLEIQYTYKAGKSFLNGVPNENLKKAIDLFHQLMDFF